MSWRAASSLARVSGSRRPAAPPEVSAIALRLLPSIAMPRAWATSMRWSIEKGAMRGIVVAELRGARGSVGASIAPAPRGAWPPPTWGRGRYVLVPAGTLGVLVVPVTAAGRLGVATPLVVWVPVPVPATGLPPPGAEPGEPATPLPGTWAEAEAPARASRPAAIRVSFQIMGRVLRAWARPARPSPGTAAPPR